MMRHCAVATFSATLFTFTCTITFTFTFTFTIATSMNLPLKPGHPCHAGTP